MAAGSGWNVAAMRAPLRVTQPATQLALHRFVEKRLELMRVWVQRLHVLPPPVGQHAFSDSVTAKMRARDIFDMGCQEHLPFPDLDVALHQKGVEEVSFP